MASDRGFDQQLAAVIAAAEGQRGANPTEELRDALNAFAGILTGKRPEALARLAEALPGLSSPSGAGFLTVWLGAGVEHGDDPEPATGPILATLMKWSRTLETASEQAEEEGPDPDEETLVGMNLLGQGLVAHLSRAPDQLASISATEEVSNELERVEHLSLGVGWVLELLRQRSGRLVVLHIKSKQGILVRYDNISNCFHLFTLLQGALSGLMPDSREASAHVLAVARGDRQVEVSDEAWWHYGQANVSEANIIASVWGEMGPDHISRIDDVQVLLLWPAVFASRSWDAGFFGPTLEAAPPNVEVVNALAPAEVTRWWERLNLPEPEA